MAVQQRFIARMWSGFFWGPPSHKRIAWVGALAGLGVFAFAAVIGARGWTAFALATLLVGASEFGWSIELAPVRYAQVAGWLRAVRWLCAIAGTVLGALCLLWGVTPAAWLGVVIAGTGALLVFEMAPGGPANRP